MSIAEPLAVPQGSAAADQQRGRAQLLLRQGKRTEAAACLQAAIKTGPGHAGDHRQLATVLTALGRFDEAQHHLERAVALRPRDAAILHDLGNLLRRQGRLDLAEGRYREALGQRPDDADTWNSLGITLLSQARPAEAADCFRRALRANAKHPQAQNNLGVALADQGKMVEAAAIYRQVLRERPDSPETQNNLGVALAAQGEYGQAIEWYGKALQLRPTYAEARNNLGNALRQDGRLEDAAASLKEALRLKPQYAEAHNNLAVVRVKQGRLEQGISGYSEAVRLKPNYAEAHLNRAMAWLMMGEWDQGWQAYEWRLQMKDFALRPLPPPRWIGEALDGRALLLRSEQGLGDVLQFVRYAPLVRQRGGTVVLECPARLIPLLQRCPGIDRLVPQGKPVPDCAYQVPLLNLPTIFRTTLETVPAAVPYLSADPERVERWRGRISGEGLRIGIAWQGSPRYVGDRHRSIALKHFEPLARLPGAQLYSLQMGHGSEQLKAVGQRWGVVDLAAQGLDKDGAFVDSAAVLQHLDLLVCSDSALAHLAGALGVPVWMAVGAAPDWRWLLHREDSPWYPSMRLFRQRQWGDWDEVFARIAQDVSVLQASAEAGMTRLGHAEQAGHLRQRGLACIKEGRLEEGIAALRLALQFDSSFAPAHNNLGVALAQLGRHDEAADCYRAALRLRPDYAEAHNNLGDLLQRQGRREEALECFRRAI
ncbi:MAG TPA: tetratricopeptide repeat protein, partial [Gemmataceae bacterium]|nr:tetratricopeptide repeat protein [Gemmataceae bacterium]